MLALHLSTVQAARLPSAVVINMPKHEKRFAGVKKELDSAGVQFERLDAVAGKELTPAQRRQNVTALARVFITPGMMGCFLSHRSAWQRCVELNQNLMVFEDDIVVEPDFAKKVRAAMDTLPSDWDVLLLGALGLVHPERKYGLWWLLHLLPSLFYLPYYGMRWKPRISEDVHVPLRPAGTHAYLISPAGARKLLSACPRASYHVDVIAWGTKGLQLFCINPLLAKQTHEDTTIGGRGDFAWVKSVLKRWEKSLVFDSYTGADIAWAFNTPLIRLGGDNWFLMLSAGRAMSVHGVGWITSLLMRWYRVAHWQLLLAVNTALFALEVAVVRLLCYRLGHGATAPAAEEAPPRPIDV